MTAAEDFQRRIGMTAVGRGKAADPMAVVVPSFCHQFYDCPRAQKVSRHVHVSRRVLSVYLASKCPEPD